ncbi:cytochrome P450 [Acidimicrobiaceae bacterium]|nr:cytochrome P450 [Acidimicrobiaceae bacterium]
MMTKPPLDKGNLLFGHSIKFNNDALSLVKNLQNKYGDIFEISILHKRVTMFMTPSATKHIYLDGEDNFSSRHGWEFSLGKTFENGLMLRDFDDHRFHRGLLQDSFRRDALANYLQIVQPLLDTWIEELQENQSFNLYATMKELMFKISLELFFDEIDNSRQKELEKLFTDAIKSATSVVRTPLPFTKLRKGLKARRSLLKYFESKAENVDIESNTLFAELVKTNKHEGGLSNYEIAEHMIFLLLAAHDTTTSTLTTAIHHLSTDKNFYQELKKEANEISLTDISELKNGVKGESLFSEAMRMYPPVPFSLRYVMRDTVVENYKLDAGTYVAIGPLVLHNDERFWENPQECDPNRFLNADETNEAYFPFSGGAHTCIGKFFASYLFKNVIYKLVSNIETISSTEPLKINPAPIPFPRKDVKITL